MWSCSVFWVWEVGVGGVSVSEVDISSGCGGEGSFIWLMGKW